MPFAVVAPGIVVAPSLLACSAASARAAVAVAYEDPTILSVEHGCRLLDGELYAVSSRIAWALLLRRTHGIDAVRCPTCAGRMRAIATLAEPFAVTKILSPLGLPTEPLPRARARVPTGQESGDEGAA